MRLKWKVLALALPVAFLVACKDQPSAPQAALEQTHAMAADWMNNADNGNANIYRFQDAYAVCWTDAKTNLRACHSTIPLGGGTPDPDCGPQDVLAPVDQQWVYVTGRDNVHAIAQGPVWITVRDLSHGGTCFDALLVAQGTGTIHSTDNAAFGIWGDYSYTDSWGWNVEGTVMTPAGRTMQYNAHYREQYSTKKGLKEVVSDINMH